MSEPILRSDLTDQQIQDVGRRIEMGVQEVDDLSELFEAEDFPENRTDAAFRILVPQRISEDDVSSFVLRENIAPTNRSLKYATFRKTVQQYGTRHEYTKESVEDNPDSVITDAVEDLDNWGTLMKKYSAVAALKGTHSAVTYDTSLMNTADKASIILSDVLEAVEWAGGEYLWIMPGQVRKVLKNELLAANYGNTIPQNEKLKAYKGYVGSYDGFAIWCPKGANKFLQDSSNYYMFFIGKTDGGKNPLRVLKKKGAWSEVYHAPLGSGIMKNADGDIVPDYNHQKGGIGENLRGFLYYLRDDRFVLMCTIAKSSLSGVIDITTEIPADGDDDGDVIQTLDRVISNAGGTTSSSASALAITGDSTVAAGSTIQLTANHEVVWSSSAEAYATVDEDGLVTGVAAGSATISAFDGSNTATITITVS